MDLILNQNDFDSYVSRIFYEEQRKLEFEEKYELMSEDARRIYNELFVNKYQINEANWLNTVGDIVGIFDPTGLVDLANAISYFYQGDTFFGMLSAISVFPYIGDAVAKPIMLAGRGSNILKMSNQAIKVAKTNPAKATKMIEQISKQNSLMGKLLDQVRVWAPKLRKLIDQIPLGKLGAPLKNTITDAIKLFETAGAGSKAAKNIAKHASKKTLTKTEAIDVLKKIQKAVEKDGRMFRDFGGAGAKGLQGLKNYKMSGMPRLIGRNKAVRSLVRRTKFWAGFLDWLGIANFVGPDELKAKMGPEFDKEFDKYSQTEEAQKNWDTEFGDVDVNQTQTSEPTGGDVPSEPSTASKTSDFTKNIVKDLIFGPITGNVV